MTRFHVLAVVMLGLAPMPLCAQPAPTTISVCASGCDGSDVLTAWRKAVSQAEHSSQVITVKIAPGRYVVNDQLFTNCTCSQLVHVIGDGRDRTKVVLQFTHIVGTNFGGFVAVNGGRIGMVDGLTIVGQGAMTGPAAWAEQSFGGGIAATGTGSTITVGSNVTVDGFYYGAIADQGGRVVASGATFRNAGDSNLLARFGGVIECLSCTIQDAGHRIVKASAPPTILGQNALAEGGSLYIDGSKLEGGLVACVGAVSNGLTWAHNVTGMKCGVGAKASQNGFIELAGSHFTENQVGVRADTGGGLNVDAVVADHNSSDGFQLDGGHASGTGARAADNGGFGIHVLKRGWGEFYGTASLLRGNKAGSTRSDTLPSCQASNQPCSASLILD